MIERGDDMTKLIPKDRKEKKWTFPEDKDDPEAIIFYLKVRTNRDRIQSNILQAHKLIENEVDFAVQWYGENISRIVNADGETLTDKQAIVDFCLDRLSENQGTQLQLAVQGMGDWLERGLLEKN